MSILISHKNAPIRFILDHSSSLNNNIDNDVSVIYCQISSNFYFYTTLLSELASSSQFGKVFYELLIKLNDRPRSLLNRKRLNNIFSSIHHRQNIIHLQVHNKINQYDEWINRSWASIQLNVLTKRVRYESSWAWLSTLGGGHSCLGEESTRHAKEAEAISKNQICLSTEVGDPNALVKSYLFLSLSYLQQKRYDEVRIILQFQYRCIQQKNITDERLRIMCIALWKKMKYAITRDKNLDQ
ncbi:unnamed protein product [Rotaria magnacalcarata]|uniref:Uncharacterized protein n=4 Tax=Rotaria magnacalcarata TaxID=392030 RepID=A0A818YJX0_9BILA|nr:unnamed protein product [Rotaria magnacalcarata]CAF1610030.1 unnamed protein product [Rotaria magnacalcarata]CAF2040912.1 unnamed protein product [Rotaria magnacalcarata]CAF2075336.1 unnamed protein product [Rotaria magnacalcarata]CAF2223862.1 unnamed protein product [Rotaria magnacalcarata]